MTQNYKNIAVIIPALNEAENLQWLLPKLCPNYTVVVVDNNSSDNTLIVAKESGALALQCKQMGYGSAVKMGCDYVVKSLADQGIKALVVFDADGTSPVEEINNVTKPILASQADIVIAQRQQLELGAMPLHAKFGNSLTVFLIRVLTGYKYSDMGPLRALTLELYGQLKMQDPTWGWNVEMQLKTAFLRRKIIQVPIAYKKRKFGKSKISGSLLGSIRAGTRILYSVGYYYLQARRL